MTKNPTDSRQRGGRFTDRVHLYATHAQSGDTLRGGLAALKEHRRP